MKKIFWGSFFILAGAFVIVNQLGYYTNINIFTLLFTIFLIPMLIKGIMKVSFPGILFPLAFLCILYAKQLGIEAITPWPILFTALLCSIGLSILFDRHHFHKNKVCTENFDQVINGTDFEEVNLSIKFGSSIKYINSEDFKVANLDCSFGEIKVYFDNAKIVDDTAIINIDISFAGLELYIPKEWEVVNNADVSLAEVSEKNKSKVKTDKKVILQGRVNIGGVEIIYV